MKWLIYGSNGWIGNQFLSYIPNDIEVVKGCSRVDDYKGVKTEIETHHPDRVITLTGRTSGPGFTTIDYLEQPGKLVENVRDNLYGPLVLKTLCNQLGIHFTYLGTGCIFSYENDTDEPFTEDSEPNFFGSSYSIVKGFTDKFMHDFPDGTLNVRIRMPITADDHPKNFISKILRYPRICSTLNSMTVLPDLLPVMVDWIVKKKTGTHHLINPKPVDHNMILKMYKEMVDPEYTWVNFEESEQNKILLSKRSKNVLTTSEIEKEYPEVPSLDKSIENIFKNWVKN